MSTHLIRSRWFVSLLFFFSLIFIAATSSLATTATISVNGTEGAVPVNGSASFTGYKHCDNATPQNCWIVDTGSLRVYRDGGYLGGSSGHGSASWSTTLDGGVMSQGSHTFKAVATDSEGVTSTSTTAITIDNTPEVTIDSPGQVEGAFDITGTATFKDSSTSYEGKIYVYIDNNYRGARIYYGTSVNWKYSEITGHMLDAGTFSQGDHAITVVAHARNGVTKSSTSNFTIDNTPEVTDPAQTCIESDTSDLCDITASVTFKERATGYEGTVRLYVNGSYRGSRTFEGKKHTVSYRQFTSSYLSVSSTSENTKIQFRATAYNGASASKTWSGPAKPCTNKNQGPPDSCQDS